MSALSRKEQDAIVARAIEILECRLPRERFMLGSTGAAQTYALLHLAGAEREIFTCLFLDAQHRVIAKEDLFKGTLTQTTVHPREVARAALKHNAASVVLVHNHPGGDPRFSTADRLLTQQLKEALALVDISVLDHLLVAGESVRSYALECAANQAYIDERTKFADHARRLKQSQAMKAAWARRKEKALAAGAPQSTCVDTGHERGEIK